MKHTLMIHTTDDTFIKSRPEAGDLEGIADSLRRLIGSPDAVVQVPLEDGGWAIIRAPRIDYIAVRPVTESEDA